MWHTRLSKLASFFTLKPHLTSDQKPAFWGFKSPPIYSKYGYKSSLNIVKHYNKYGGTKWSRKLLGKLCFYVPQRTYIYHESRKFSSKAWLTFEFNHIPLVMVRMIGKHIVEALESDLKAMKDETVSVGHLEGLDWEFVVVDEPIVNAFCLPGGKIVVYTGLLKEFKSNAAIATVIGHEVGHIVARHGPQRLNKFMLRIYTRNIFGLSQSKQKVEDDDNPYGVSELSKVLFKYPGRRRDEREADYIGLLVMASAGYDPQEAPKVYEMFEKFSSPESELYRTHPSGKKRAKNLAKGKVMEEARFIYSKAIDTRKKNDLKDRWFWY